MAYVFCMNRTEDHILLEDLQLRQTERECDKSICMGYNMKIKALLTLHAWSTKSQTMVCCSSNNCIIVLWAFGVHGLCCWTTNISSGLFSHINKNKRCNWSSQHHSLTQNTPCVFYNPSIYSSNKSHKLQARSNPIVYYIDLIIKKANNKNRIWWVSIQRSASDGLFPELCITKSESIYQYNIRTSVHIVGVLSII